MKRVVFIVLLLVLSFAGCVSTAQRDVPFDYSQVLTKEYRFGTGRAIPLTFERSVNVSGTITADGKYFIYASNRERNNFDIYLRPLNDITTFRLTVHPAKDFAPDVSPDGKWCVFVSTRDDPHGDILLMKLNIATIVSQRELESEQPSKNLTTIKDATTGAIVPIRDASPCFSPDGKWIAFSSEREGEESIFIMDRDGNNVRKITGGMQPRFSNDGNAILFTKQDGKGTNLYRVTVATGAIEKLTNNSSLQLSPCYGKTDDDIYFTRIEHDTNGDGMINANDNGMLYYYNAKTGEEYPLTLIDESSTAPRWVSYAGGVIVYSVVEGEYINMAMIPHTGIIPKQKNALRQYELALKYKEDFDDIERYQRCLFATYYFFRDAVDIDSQMIIAKALYELSNNEHYTAAKQILQELSPGSKPASLYAQFISLKDNNTIVYLEKNIKELKAEKNEKLTPFFMEELADRYVRQGSAQRALTAYRDIVDTYTTYSRLAYVRFKIGRLLYKGFDVPEEWLVVLGSSYTYLKNEITMEVVNATKQLPAAQRYAGAKEAVERYTLPIAKAIFQYIAATSLLELGKNEEALLYLKQGLANTKKLDVAYFLFNVKSGELAQKQKSDDWAGYYEAATNNFQAQWKQDIRPIIEQLIDYFETNGQKLYEEGKYKESSELYKRYITMNTLLYLRRRYQDVYNINAAGAHIGYINASIPLQHTMLETLENEYSGQGHRLSVARMDFDKAHIYALGYIYVQKAISVGSSPRAMEGRASEEFEKQLDMLKQALYHIDWALFIDDRFVDAYLLKGWVYQYVDELRMCCPSKKRLIDSYFSEYLWEQCIPLYEKALEANDEAITPYKEADIHTNLANIYFLLKNYTLALPHYNKAVSYQKAFTSLKEEAQFYYHYGYCLWQQGNYSGAYAAMQRSYSIYRAIAQKNEPLVEDQLYTLYKYFALFQQMQGNYKKAIEWYTTSVIHATRYNHGKSNSRLYIAIAECYRKLENDREALSYLELAEKSLPSTKETQYKVGLKIATLGPVYIFTIHQDDIVIGEGKIVSELSPFEMELLINSMTAEIYINNGRFTDALARYDKIIKLAGNRKSSLLVDVTFFALQNAGYCAVQSGQISDALGYYEKALAIAQQEAIDVDKVYRMMLQ
ncbi:MAG TPA: tetratricopeptide repeat protein, partial [Spirochaetota bacterium]|nr:tetratricopeptide repeat protein [Spirochaetota bacterium]